MYFHVVAAIHLGVLDSGKERPPLQMRNSYCLATAEDWHLIHLNQVLRFTVALSPGLKSRGATSPLRASRRQLLVNGWRIDG